MATRIVLCSDTLTPEVLQALPSGRIAYLAAARLPLLQGWMRRRRATEWGIEELELVNDQHPQFDEKWAAIIVEGGNTYRLAWWLDRHSGFTVALKEAVKAGLLYLGISAGAIVAGPVIDLAAVCGDLSLWWGTHPGLHLTGWCTLPHTKGTQEEAQAVKAFAQRTKRPTWFIYDGEAFSLDEDDMPRRIGRERSAV